VVAAAAVRAAGPEAVPAAARAAGTEAILRLLPLRRRTRLVAAAAVAAEETAEAARAAGPEVVPAAARAAVAEAPAEVAAAVAAATAPSSPTHLDSTDD
jgi:hypothetical protein